MLLTAPVKVSLIAETVHIDYHCAVLDSSAFLYRIENNIIITRKTSKRLLRVLVWKMKTSIQWNLSKADTIGTATKIVHYRKGVLWSGVYYT